MAVDVRRCPACGSVNAVRIVYGFPTQADEKQAEEGKIRLGGDRVSEDAPDCRCRDCGHEWNRREAITEACGRVRRVRACVSSQFTGYKDVSVDLSGGTLAWDQYSSRESEHFIRRVGEPDLERFRKRLAILGVLDWKSAYVLPDVLAGVKWTLDITLDGKNVRKYGSNAYPPKWEAFCRLLSDLSGREFG